MATGQKRRGNRQVLRVILLLALLMPVASLALGQELKQVSPTLAAKIAESGRKRVAVVDFTDLQGNVSELGRFLAEELSGALVNDARGFRVIDRAHLKAILQEHKLAATGLIDPATARQLGKIAGVDTLVTGTITSAFGDTVRVMVKALDVSTAEIIGQSTADIPKTEWIQRLLGQGIATGIPAPSGSKEGPAPQPATGPKPAGAFVEENDLLFVLRSCGRSGQKLKCTGSVTNKGRKRRDVQVGYLAPTGMIRVVDSLGNQYQGTAGWSEGNNRTDLEPDLPVNFSATVDDVDPNATWITLILSYALENGFGGSGILTFRKLPIK